MFRDSISGAKSDRAELQALLKFLRKQKEHHVVIVDDISRLARSVEAHIKLRLVQEGNLKARAMNGYWPLYTPVGYRYDSVKGHSGRMLVRDEPVASIVQEALEGFAHGRFEIQSEIQRFLQNEEAFPKDKSGQVRFQRVTNMLKKVIYSGYITVPKWGITFQDGKHEPLTGIQEARFNGENQ